MIKLIKLAAAAVTDLFGTLAKTSPIVAVSKHFCAKDRIVKTTRVIK